MHARRAAGLKESGASGSVPRQVNSSVQEASDGAKGEMRMIEWRYCYKGSS